MLIPRIALVGTPNAGKTALFNFLTRSHQRVANYSGVTIESAEADFNLPSGGSAALLDLPGAYSLRPYTEEENVLADVLRAPGLDGMILVVDATQPERAVRFLIEVLDATSIPAVVAWNLSDLARDRGIRVDCSALSDALGVPVISTSAVKGFGLDSLKGFLESALKNQKRSKGAFLDQSSESAQPQEASQRILSFYKKADQVLKSALLEKGRADDRSRKIDGILLHPVAGPVILTLVLLLIFQLMFNLASYPMEWIESFFSWVQSGVADSSLPVLLKSFLSDGVLAGIGGTLVFLPQILILFALILFLEDFGFMARAVFMLDHLMGKVGLHGRAFLPLLSSYACAVPGILSTRAIENRRDRIITTMIIPLTTCSARIPVYTLLISAFIPNHPVGLGLNLQGLVMFGLYASGIGFSLISGAILKRFLFSGKRPPLLIELPSYKRPSFQSLARGLLYRTRLFLKRVGTVILGVSVVIWFLVSFPQGEGASVAGIDQSYAAKVGRWIEPAIRPIGMDWRIGMALIPTLAAREVMVGTLATVYAVQGDSGVSNTERLSLAIKKEWTLATGLSLLAWFIFAPMCISTLAAARRELGKNSYFLLMIAYLFSLAYGASWCVYRIFI